MTRIDGHWIDTPETVTIFNVLEGADHAVYFVGGCVRDALAELTVHDIDIATDARPDEVIRLAEAAGLKAVPTGVDHGTVTLVVGGAPFEVTTFRRDVETDGRRAVVAFSNNMEDDARRRDFTINALYADRTGRVIDPTGRGVPDLSAGVVRFVGDAETRIREDYLRILRYFRFYARFGRGGPDPDALHAISSNLGGLAALSAERIGAEVKALLSLADPAEAMGAMAATGALTHVLPGADATPVAPLQHLEQIFGCEPDAIRRLAAIGGEDVPDRLRLSRAEAKQLVDTDAAISADMGAEELGYRFGETIARDAILVRAARGGDYLDPATLASARDGAARRFPVEAADLLPEVSGKALGERLKELENRWIASGFRLSRDELLRL